MRVPGFPAHAPGCSDGIIARARAVVRVRVRALCLFTEKFEWNLFYCDLIIQSESNPLVNPIIWR